MRACVIVVLMAGCAAVRPPVTVRPASADPSVLEGFAALTRLPQRLEEASEYAERHHLTPGERISAARPAYEGYLRAEAYALAAEVAWRFGFDLAARSAPGARQRQRTLQAVERARQTPGAAFWHMGGALNVDQEISEQDVKRELAVDALISCFFLENRQGEGEALVTLATEYYQASYETGALLPLLPAGCPVKTELRTTIIRYAFWNAPVEYVIREAIRAGWNADQKADLAADYFKHGFCSSGFRVASALGTSKEDVTRFIAESACETVVKGAGWVLSENDAQAYFFAAVRSLKLSLGLALLPFCGFDENGQLYLFQEALRRGVGINLLSTIASNDPSLREPFIRYAFEQGRFRFVGMHAPTLEWQRAAFDKLIELHQYAFAAEVAEFSLGEAFRKEGVLLAFEAAMNARDSFAARYLLVRYGPVRDRSGKKKPGILDQLMYDRHLVRRE